MINKIKEFFEKKKLEDRLITKGKLMYHKKEKLKGTEDLLVQKGYYQAEREELRSIERLKRMKEMNDRMKVRNGRKVPLSDNPFGTPVKPKKKKKSSTYEMELKW